MARFMLLIKGDHEAWEDMSPEEQARIEEGHHSFAAAAGTAILDGGELDGRATSVRSRHGGDPEVTDGPFTQADEVVGGYYLLETPDLDRAIHLAALLPEAHAPYRAGVEIRELVETIGRSDLPARPLSGPVRACR